MASDLEFVSGESFVSNKTTTGKVVQSNLINKVVQEGRKKGLRRIVSKEKDKERVDG